MTAPRPWARIRRAGLLVAVGLPLLADLPARPPPPPDARAAFRRAVDEYQLFVVPICQPATVEAYVAARGERDRAFVRSLRRKGLRRDYDQAVADWQERERHTVHHCFGPPAERPPGVPEQPSDPAGSERERRAAADRHFASGDRQFAAMARLRDDVNGRSGR